MAFWETMTIGQMGSLMASWEEPQARQVWGELKDDLASRDQERWYRILEQRDQHGRATTPFQLDDRAKTPALYLLTFAAVICEKALDGPMDLDAVGQRYHLEQLLDEGGQYGWQYSLKKIVPTRDFPNEEDRLAQCWLRIQNHIGGWPDMDQDATLAELFQRVEEANRRAYDYDFATDNRSEELLITDGLNSFKDFLTHWDESIQTLCQQYGGTLQFPDQIRKDICALIKGGVRQIVLTGAPGTGKTYTAGRVAQMLGTPLPRYAREACPYPLVQFHPSYDYTDFVEGLRPVAVGGETHFLRLDGSFKAFCRQVADKGEADKLYFFLIDEINRADLSKVFGELMFCLESDKRGESHKVQTQYWNLPTYLIDEVTLEPYPCEEDAFSAGFFIPENVVILGTMNDIDRSVESMDFALRRRFVWLEAEVNEALLAQAFASQSFGPVLNRHSAEAAQRVMALNQVIAPQGEASRGVTGARFGLNRQYYIAQGQFTGLPEDIPQQPGQDELTALLQFVWDCRLRSLLREYVRGEDEREVEAFLDRCYAAFLPEGARHG